MRFIYMLKSNIIYEILHIVNDNILSVRDSENAKFHTLLNLKNHPEAHYVLLEEPKLGEKMETLEFEVTSLREEVEDMKKWIDKFEQNVDFNRGGFIS